MRIREKLLKFDFDRKHNLNEASYALSDRFGVDVGAHEDAVVQRLEAQVEVKLGARGHPDHGISERVGGGDVEAPLPHLARAVQEVEHLDGEWRLQVI